MNKWEYRKFGDVVEVNPKVIFDKKELYDFIEMADVQPGKKYVYPSQSREVKGGAKFQEGDTLFARITPCLEHGKISQAKGLKNRIGFGSTEFYVFRGKNGETDNDFVYYLSLTNEIREPAIKSMIGASGRQRAQISIIQNLEIALPPLPVQQKIASILSAYDDLIENNLKRIKLLEEMARITYEEWFVRFKVNGKGLKVDAKTGLPAKWNKKILGEVVDYLSRGVSPKYVDDNGIVVVNQKCIRNGNISFEQARLTSYESKIPDGKFLHLWDILINSTGAGTLGRVAQVIGLEKKITVDTHVSIVRANPTIISPVLLGFAIKSQEGLITSMGKGSTNQLELSRNDLRDLVEIIVPDLDTQKKFNTIVEPILRLIHNLTKQNSLLKEARDILLPRLMNGSIDVSSLEEKTEPKVIPIQKEKQREASWEFKEAVLISVLTYKFSSQQYPLGRKRYTKLSYLFHRHAEEQVQNYLRKAAGPYNPKTKYQGPEKIAHDNGYVVDHQNGKLSGFVSGKNIAAARTYFENYWSIDYINWLETNFKYKSNDELELYATVDNAMLELYKKNKAVTVPAIKEIIKTEKEWKAKLDREIFSDGNIQKAINYLPTLFQYQ